MTEFERIRPINHEMRTKLSTILTYADLLTDGCLGELSPRQQEALESIHRAASNAAELSRSLSLELRNASDSTRVQCRS